jgi:thymidine kinase
MQQTYLPEMSTTSHLTVICGPMYGSKSLELIRLVDRAVIACENVVVYKPIIDNRYGSGITSHNSIDLEKLTGIKPIEIECSLEDIVIPRNANLIAFDEAQFFNEKIVSIITDLIYQQGKQVVCAGLDLDSDGKPFGHMPELLALADSVIKLKAICMICHKPATRTFCKIQKTNQVMIGGTSVYEARCKSCWKLAL